MSRFRTIALVLALTVGAAGAAAAQSAGATDTVPPAATAHHGERARHARRGERALFRGVQLTQAQRTQLDSINQKYRAEAKSIRDSMRPALEEARAARQHGDSAGARAAWQRTADQRSQLRSLRERQLGEVRSMLTPEQRARFDQNEKALRARMRERHGGHHRGQKAGAA